MKHEEILMDEATINGMLEELAILQNISVSPRHPSWAIVTNTLQKEKEKLRMRTNETLKKGDIFGWKGNTYIVINDFQGTYLPRKMINLKTGNDASWIIPEGTFVKLVKMEFSE
jgi:hypothetical protein